MANPKSWHGDWHQRIRDGLARLGLPSVTSYAKQHPAWTYRELAENLGKDIAPVQIQGLERDEAMSENRFSDFARDCLVRSLRECMPEGWGRGEDPDFHIAHSLGAWGGTLGEGYTGEVVLVANALKAAAIPSGWLPEGPDDPFIVAALHGVELRTPEE